MAKISDDVIKETTKIVFYKEVKEKDMNKESQLFTKDQTDYLDKRFDQKPKWFEEFEVSLNKKLKGIEKEIQDIKKCPTIQKELTK